MQKPCGLTRSSRISLRLGHLGFFGTIRICIKTHTDIYIHVYRLTTSWDCSLLGRSLAYRCAHRSTHLLLSFLWIQSRRAMNPIMEYSQRGPRAGSGLRTCYIRTSQQVIKYKKLVVNDGDFMKEFKRNELFKVLQITVRKSSAVFAR